MSEHLHGTCTTSPLTSPLSVLTLPMFISFHLLALPTPSCPGGPHLPLAWVHLGTPHPLCPMIGFRSGSRMDRTHS